MSHHPSAKVAFGIVLGNSGEVWGFLGAKDEDDLMDDEFARVDSLATELGLSMAVGYSHEDPTYIICAEKTFSASEEVEDLPGELIFGGRIQYVSDTEEAALTKLGAKLNPPQKPRWLLMAFTG